MPIFKRKTDNDTWHWCTNCPNYPKGSDVVISYSKPSYGELCKECMRNYTLGNCGR